MSFQIPFTCEMEYWKHVFLRGSWLFSYANQSKKKKTKCGIHGDTLLKDFTDLEKEVLKQQ